MSHREFFPHEMNWQPVTGCTEIGPGCDSCPSMEVAREKEGTPGHDFEHGFGVRLWPERLSIPEHTDEKKIFFVCLGSDLFHDAVPDDFIFKVFAVINQNPRHYFEILTKRADRLAYLSGKLEWTKNIFIGVTVATKGCLWRVDVLRNVPAIGKFLSMCPLLEDLGAINLKGITHVCAVEESWGPKRKVEPEWIANIKTQCEAQGVPFNFEPAVVYGS